MAKRNQSGLRLDADFTEDMVGFALEAFLAILDFPGCRFTIEPFSRSRERWLGADARLLGNRVQCFRPFYMQFKRPLAYPDYSTSPIVEDRRSLKLTVAPRSLFFPLRQRRANANQHRSQHNTLFQLRRRLTKYNLGDAAYVCPLFLDRSAYRYYMHLSGLCLWQRYGRRHPWQQRGVDVHHGNVMMHFANIPILEGHISIPPHGEVNPGGDEHTHKYSFGERGQDLCFHSPKDFPDGGASSLAAFLQGVQQDFPEGDNNVTPENSAGLLEKLAGWFEDEDSLFDALPFSDDDWLGNWLDWGDRLRSNYGIEQFAFVAWKDS